MSHSRVISIAIDPSSPAIVYAGTKGDAVYKSYDGGQRWVGKNNGLEDVTITSVVNQLVFEPASENHLFAATSMGVFESSDGGDTWKKRMEGLKDILMVVTVAVEKLSQVNVCRHQRGRIQVCGHGSPLGEGQRGTEFSRYLLFSSRALMVNSLVIDPATPLRPAIIYAATLSGLSPGASVPGRGCRKRSKLLRADRGEALQKNGRVYAASPRVCKIPITTPPPTC